MDACLRYINIEELDALVQARLRVQDQEEHCTESGEELKFVQHGKATECHQIGEGLSESSSLPQPVDNLLDDRSHDGRRHAKLLKYSTSPRQVLERTQDDLGFRNLADLTDSDKYFEVTRWLELLPTDYSVAHHTALEESASRHPTDTSVTGQSQPLEDYPALLSYATFELFTHAKLAEAQGVDPGRIISRLQHGGTWSRWVALREDVPQSMKLEDYAIGQGLISWVSCISGDSKPASSLQLNSSVIQRKERIVSKNPDGSFRCTENGCIDVPGGFKRRCEWE
jgi:hypothetical protein